MAGPVVHTYRAAESGLYVNSYLRHRFPAACGLQPPTWSCLAWTAQTMCRPRLSPRQMPLLVRPHDGNARHCV